MSVRECRNCEYLGLGNFCHRYPPNREGGSFSLHPVVHNTGWCGEFLEKGICQICAKKNYGGFCTCPSKKKEKQPSMFCMCGPPVTMERRIYGDFCTRCKKELV